MKRYGLIVLLLLAVAGLVVARKYILDWATNIVTPDIKVESRTNLVSVSEIQRGKIRETMEQVKFFDNGGVTYYTPSTAQRGSVSVRKVKVILSPVRQPLGLTYYHGESEPFQSWGVEYTPTALGNQHDLTISLYVREDIAAREGSESLAKWYQGVLLNAVWDLSHPQKAEYSGMERFSGMSEYIQNGVREHWWRVERMGGKS